MVFHRLDLPALILLPMLNFKARWSWKALYGGKKFSWKATKRTDLKDWQRGYEDVGWGRSSGAGSGVEERGIQLVKQSKKIGQMILIAAWPQPKG